MCGIAGIIYKDGHHNVGQDMTRMLQSMKHRGPDSTGYALYAPPTENVVLRYTTANTTTPRDFEFADRIRRNEPTGDQPIKVGLIELGRAPLRRAPVPSCPQTCGKRSRGQL